MLVAVVELSGLFFLGQVSWRWEIRLPEASPVLSRLADLSDAGLVAGRLLNLPVNAGRTTSYPNLGITPPPPDFFLEPSISPPGQNAESEHRWQNRFGVTHGVWVPVAMWGEADILAEIADPALDEVMSSVPNLHRRPWALRKLVRKGDAFPAAWVAHHVREAANWGRTLLRALPPTRRTMPGSSPRTTPPSCRHRVHFVHRGELGRPPASRRARRLLYPDHEAYVLSRLDLSSRRRPRPTRAQGRWRPSGVRLVGSGTSRGQSATGQADCRKPRISLAALTAALLVLATARMDGQDGREGRHRSKTIP